MFCYTDQLNLCYKFMEIFNVYCKTWIKVVLSHWSWSDPWEKFGWSGSTSYSGSWSRPGAKSNEPGSGINSHWYDNIYVTTVLYTEYICYNLFIIWIYKNVTNDVFVWIVWRFISLFISFYIICRGNFCIRQRVGKVT